MSRKTGFLCPLCEAPTRVLDSYTVKSEARRRIRECSGGHRMATDELPVKFWRVLEDGTGQEIPGPPVAPTDIQA